MSSSSSPEPSMIAALHAEDIDNDVWLYDICKVPPDGHSDYPNLQPCLEAQIQSITVEFLHTNGIIPHTQLKLNFATEIEAPCGIIKSAILSMHPLPIHGLFSVSSTVCHVNLTHRWAKLATIAFEFKAQKEQTLLNYINVVKGIYKELEPPAGLEFTSNLTDFSFIEVGSDKLWDGCRDWVAQVFVRFHALGWVSWHINKILGRLDRTLYHSRKTMTAPANAQLTSNWDHAGFHDIIDKNYTDDSITDEILYETLPLEKGVFGSPNFIRMYKDHEDRYVLPYRT